MKTLIAIKGCEAHRDRWLAERNTWADSPLVHYFTGHELHVSDDYESLPAKSKAICNWAKDVCDYCFLTDTDAYVNIPRLLASRFYLYDYSGFVRDDGFKPEYCYGPGYWLSKKAMEILAGADWSQFVDCKFKGDTWESCIKGYETCEDVMVGAVLYAHGITPHHDPRYALYHDVLPDNDIISSHLSNAGKPFKIEYMYEAHRKATNDVRQMREGADDLPAGQKAAQNA